jgi:rhodanese-related sulfurtransferase
MADATQRTTIDELLAQARAKLDHRPTAAEAAVAVDRGEAILVDIRSTTQRADDGVIPATVWHPRNVLEWRADPTSSHADPALSGDLDAHLIVVCNEGYASSLAAATLREIGFAHATDLDGGFQAWRAAGLPVEPAQD